MKSINLAILLILAAVNTTTAFAYDHIVRPYQSVRNASMGGTRIMTGLYEENFYGNPARASANPTWKIQVFDLSVETGASTISALGDLMGSGDTFQKVASTEGDNLHARVQTAMPGFYLPLGRMNYGIALLTSSQFDLGLRKNYTVDGLGILDIGPAFTASRKFLDDESLAVGMTAHFAYRLSTKDGYGLTDFVRGISLSPAQSGGQGSHLDFDLGSTYRFNNFKPGDWNLSVGTTVSNILDGRYANMRLRPVANAINRPRQQPRSYAFGVSANRDSLLFFRDALFAFEVSDIGNNPNGSLYRTIHMGGEVRWSILNPRIGINQGYLTGGLGIDLKIFELDLGTYGEEMTLNPGGLEDRRYALRIAFQI